MHHTEGLISAGNAHQVAGISQLLLVRGGCIAQESAWLLPRQALGPDARIPASCPLAYEDETNVMSMAQCPGHSFTRRSGPFWVLIRPQKRTRGAMGCIPYAADPSAVQSTSILPDDAIGDDADLSFSD